MSEQLYRKSWEPLSEANKSAPQVVRHKDKPDMIECHRYDENSGTWGDIMTYIAKESVVEFEFLCLTPV